MLARVLAHLFFRQRVDHLGVRHYLFQLLQPFYRLADRLEICQHSAEPAIVDIKHSASFSLFSNDVLRLLLSADEHDCSALSGEVAHRVEGAVEQAYGLLEVDYVNAVASSEDVRLHLRIPAAGLM